MRCLDIHNCIYTLIAYRQMLSISHLKAQIRDTCVTTAAKSDRLRVPVYPHDRTGLQITCHILGAAAMTATDLQYVTVTHVSLDNAVIQLNEQTVGFFLGRQVRYYETGVIRQWSVTIIKEFRRRWQTALHQSGQRGINQPAAKATDQVDNARRFPGFEGIIVDSHGRISPEKATRFSVYELV